MRSANEGLPYMISCPWLSTGFGRNPVPGGGLVSQLLRAWTMTLKVLATNYTRHSSESIPRRFKYNNTSSAMRYYRYRLYFEDGLVISQSLDHRMLLDLLEGFGFYLADTFARDVELFSDLFERVAYAVHQAETHLEDLLFAG